MPKESARSGAPTNLMATVLPPVDQKEVVRCDVCKLVQFRALRADCRRCHKPLDGEPEPIVPAPPPMPVPDDDGRGYLATSIRFLRLRNGLSQRQLAGRMKTPRTYVSKIETDRVVPTLSSLERLAAALEVDIPELLNSGARTRKEEAVIELLRDEFVASLLPFVSQLTLRQMGAILIRVHELSTRNKRLVA